MEAIKTFLNVYNHSANTRRSYETDLNDFVKYSNIKKIGDISSSALVDYRDYLMLKGLASTTVYRKIASIKSFCKWAFKEDLIKKDPSTNIKVVKPAPKNPTSAFSDEEVSKILSIEKPLKHQLALLMLFNCGLRRSEVINIKVSDIKNYKNHLVLQVIGKGSKRREIPLNDSIKQRLNEYLEKELPKDSLFGWTDNSRVYSLVVGYAKKAGVKTKAGPHSCRATFITKALEAGVPITDVADVVGHSSIQTTHGYWRRRRGFEESPTYKINFGS